MDRGVLRVGAAIAVAVAQNAWRSPGPLAEAICLSVPRGATMYEVTEDLAENVEQTHRAPPDARSLPGRTL